MLLFNNHVHTEFSHDATGSIDSIATEAIRNGLFGFSVSDHCDCEYISDSHLKSVLDSSFFSAETAKQKYNDKLIISCGVEIGEAIFDNSVASAVISSHPWDVVLGSVHAVRMNGFDMPFSQIDFSTMSDEFITEYTDRYFEDLYDTACSCDYDILSHLNVIFRYIKYKFNRNIAMERYYPVCDKILRVLISRNKSLEINTSGYKDGYFMPDYDLLKMYKDLGGKNISIGSDSHRPSDITSGLIEGHKLVKQLGFNEITYYIDRKPYNYEINN